MANTEDIWLSPEGIFLVPSFFKTSFNLLLLCVWWEGNTWHGMCLSRCTSDVRVNFVEFFTLPLCGLGTELRLPGVHRQPLYLRNHLTDLFKYLPETLHTRKAIHAVVGEGLCWYCPFCLRSIAQYASLEYRIHFISQHALYAAPLPSVVLISLLYAIALLIGMSFLFAYHKL